MQKKSYQKPEIKEVKLIMEDTMLTVCRSRRSNTVNSRTSGSGCSVCRTTYGAS